MHRLVSSLRLKKSKQPLSQSGHPIPKDHQDAIYAFRTITTMLAHIHSPTETTNSRERTVPDKDERRELRLLDALAVIAVREHEIVAAVAKGNDGSSIQVLLSANSVDFPLNIPQHSKSPSIWNDPIHWFITPNPRDHGWPRNRKEPIDSLTQIREDTYMRVVDPSSGVSQVLSTVAATGTSSDLLDAFLSTAWGKESFDTHIWMLKTLIAKSRDDRNSLQYYIIAASFPKMIHRFQVPRVSKRYFNCLKDMDLNTFDFTEPPLTTATMDGLEDGDLDKMFIDSLPGFAKATTDISSLRAAKAKSTGTHCEIYNRETYRAFHNLLCEILQNFLQSLIKLSKICSENLKTEIGLRSVEEIRKQLLVVCAMGRSLRAMVRSAAIGKHLNTIADLLEVEDGDSWTVAAKGDDVEFATEEGDAEFDALEPYSIHGGRPLLPWQSYQDWLSLMVTYFDAESILRSHVHRFSEDVDISVEIKILAPSLPTQHLLPWKDLLRHETYFPELTDDPAQPSVEDLIKFLTSDYAIIEDIGDDEAPEKGLDEILKLLQNLGKQQESTHLDFEKIHEKVSQLKGCSSHGSAECTEIILANIEAMKLPGQTHLALLPLIQETLEIVKTLKARSALFWALKEGKPLSNGCGFMGTRHCEASLAAFNSISGQACLQEQSHYKDLLSEFERSGRTIGVSKRCCPVCARLLDLLKTRDGKTFLTTAGHSTITPCTLPEWLPTDIIKAMTVEFGRRLRGDLVRLQQRTEVLRRRSSSIDTRRISLDSMIQRNDAVDCDELDQAFAQVQDSLPSSA